MHDLVPDEVEVGGVNLASAADIGSGHRTAPAGRKETDPGGKP
jgi:hypothetical protein